MKKALLLSAVLIVLALAAVAFIPQVDAQACMRCPNTYAWTPGQWGWGSTCDDAKHAAVLNAYYWTYSACGADGPCDWGAEEVLTMGDCMWDGSQYKADARVQYKCTINLCY